MRRNQFLKLYDALNERIAKEGKKSPEWFLGFVEGFGKQLLTGYQIGALYYLIVLPEHSQQDCSTENLQTDSGNLSPVSIPGVI